MWAWLESISKYNDNQTLFQPNNNVQNTLNPRIIKILPPEDLYKVILSICFNINYVTINIIISLLSFNLGL